MTLKGNLVINEISKWFFLLLFLLLNFVEELSSAVDWLNSLVFSDDVANLEPIVKDDTWFVWRRVFAKFVL